MKGNRKRVLGTVLLLGGGCCLLLVSAVLRSTPVGRYAAFPLTRHDDGDRFTFWSGVVKWNPGCNDDDLRRDSTYQRASGGPWVWDRGNTKFILRPGIFSMSVSELNNPTNTVALKRHLTSTVIVLLMGCKPTWDDLEAESERAFQLYLEGDATAARKALLEQERTLPKYESAEDREAGYQIRFIHYARLSAVAWHLNETNQAQEYYEKAMANRQRSRALSSSTNAFTMSQMVDALERGGHKMKPK
jgi:hypothetical protein